MLFLFPHYCPVSSSGFGKSFSDSHWRAAAQKVKLHEEGFAWSFCSGRVGSNLGQFNGVHCCRYVQQSKTVQQFSRVKQFSRVQHCTKVLCCNYAALTCSAFSEKGPMPIFGTIRAIMVTYFFEADLLGRFERLCRSDKLQSKSKFRRSWKCFWILVEPWWGIIFLVKQIGCRVWYFGQYILDRYEHHEYERSTGIINWRPPYGSVNFANYSIIE